MVRYLFPLLTLLLVGCSVNYEAQQREDQLKHHTVSMTQSMIKVNLVHGYRNNEYYPGSSYKLYLDNKYLLTADNHRVFHLKDKKLRWQLFEYYKKNGKLCFEIRRDKPKYELSIYSNQQCLINTELENKFAIDIEIERLDEQILASKKQLAREAVTYNTNFNSKTQQCDKPYIRPISNLCNKSQSELDRLYIDCFRPLGSKACRYLAKKGIEQKALSSEEKRRQKYASAFLCKKVVGGEITGAEIADELGDELTSSDNLLAQIAGYTLEAGAALATTASVTSCLDRFNMHCDVKANQRKERYYQQCNKDLVSFNERKDDLNTQLEKVQSLRYQRSKIVRNREPKEFGELVFRFRNRF